METLVRTETMTAMDPQLTAFAPPEGDLVSFGRPGGHE